MDDTSGATFHDPSRHDATRHANSLRHTLTVRDVETQLVAAGVPRSHRHVERLCKNGSFDAAPVGPAGEWMVAPDSVPKVIGDLRALDERKTRHVATQTPLSQDVAHEISNNANHDPSRHDATRHDTSALENKERETATERDTSRHVELLEMQLDEKDKRIGDKDKQIDFLQDELKDRRDQIRGMKEIIVEQKLLLESMNRNVAPIFDALASAVKEGVFTPKGIEARTINTTQSREVDDTSRLPDGQ